MLDILEQIWFGSTSNYCLGLVGWGVCWYFSNCFENIAMYVRWCIPIHSQLMKLWYECLHDARQRPMTSSRTPECPQRLAMLHASGVFDFRTKEVLATFEKFWFGSISNYFSGVGKEGYVLILTKLFWKHGYVCMRVHPNFFSASEIVVWVATWWPMRTHDL